MKKATQVQKASEISPVFQHGGDVGHSHPYVVVADLGGKLWHVNVEAGEPRPVTFKK